jgi:hypothetical protein
VKVQNQEVTEIRKGQEIDLIGKGDVVILMMKMIILGVKIEKPLPLMIILIERGEEVMEMITNDQEQEIAMCHQPGKKVAIVDAKVKINDQIRV